MNMRRLAMTLAYAWVMTSAASAAAQVRAPSDGGMTASLGQPRLLKWTGGVAAGWVLDKGYDPRVLEGRLGAYGDLINPLFGIASVHGEVYGGARDSDLDGGIRLRLVNPTARFGIGTDYNVSEGRARLILSAYHAGRRGGVFRDGSLIRVDYIPGRNQFVSIGLETPAWRRIPTGRSRPRLDHVRVGNATAAPATMPGTATALAQPLAAAGEAAAWIRRLNAPFLTYAASGIQAERAVTEELAELKRSLAAAGLGDAAHTPAIEVVVRRFHAELDRAFSIAIAGHALAAGEVTADGRRAAAQARSILLAEVLLPYDRLLGQLKKPDGITAFANRARGIFVRWLYVESGLPPERTGDLLWVFRGLIDIVDANRAAARAEWNDSRFVWLPLQYALLPEDHDSQAELDAIIEQAVDTRFSEGNFVSYVINEQFQAQLSRTIRAAEDYHVLWTHDYRGYDGGGDVDEMAYRQTLNSYLAAMIERVRAYDRTGKFPVYMIFLDEVFYQVNRGRLWMNLLEDPTEYRLRLPAKHAEWEEAIRTAQDSLRAAIAGSALLQAQRGQFGDRWLRNLIKVHVNITNAADPSFWSWNIVPFVPIPDNMLRDHRKIVFYDLTEEDPYRGEAIFTGAGIGEHYSNKSWEDRSLVVRGPAVLELKNVATNTLLNQGITADRIPYVLDARPKAADYDERIRVAVARNQRPLRALQLHNGTGYAAKDVNVAKAVLYTLMPPGSVIKIPDSLWNDAFWGATMLGCALRGVRVLIISPAYANHPVRAKGSRLLARELLWRLLTAGHVLANEIAAAGGLLKLGVYAPDFDVTNVPAKVASVKVALAKHAWLRELFGFPPALYAELDELVAQLNQIGMPADTTPDFEYDPSPKLHLKANFFASREAWTLMSRREWVQETWGFLLKRLEQVQGRQAALTTFTRVPDPMVDLGSGMVEDWYAGLSPATRARVVFYTMMGSQNQNFRSMVIDGEDAFVVANWPSVIPYLDLISLVGQSRWIETTAELDALLPRYSALMNRVRHWFALIF